MPFVQRDQGGNVVGEFANRQPGYAEEHLRDDHPDVVAHRDRMKPQPVQKPPAPPEPSGNSIVALRAEVAILRQALIDAGVFTP